MENDIGDFVKACFSVIATLCYCHGFLGKKVPKGIPRFLCVLPIVCLYLYLPLHLNILHFRGLTAFFIAWLANFKLLLFACGKGPLCSDDGSSISLPQFLAVATLPIKLKNIPSIKSLPDPKIKENQFLNSTQDGKIKANPSPGSLQDGETNIISPSPKSFRAAKTNTNQSPKSLLDPDGKTKEKSSPRQNLHDGEKSTLKFVIRALLLAMLVKVHDYSDILHPKIMSLLHFLQMYMFLEVVLTLNASLVRVLLGVELEPQFKEPYLSTSLQDFWSRRWNLMVTGILRPTVYEPTRNLASCLIGRKWAPIPASLGTFFVSAMMHELMFYYLGREKPTWEITWFFLLHGLCLTVEIALKKAFAGRWRLPRLIAGPLTMLFVISTGFRLFLPSLYRCNVFEAADEEYAAFAKLVGNFREQVRSYVIHGYNEL